MPIMYVRCVSGRTIRRPRRPSPAATSRRTRTSDGRHRTGQAEDDLRNSLALDLVVDLCSVLGPGGDLAGSVYWREVVLGVTRPSWSQGMSTSLASYLLVLATCILEVGYLLAGVHSKPVRPLVQWCRVCRAPHVLDALLRPSPRRRLSAP